MKRRIYKASDIRMLSACDIIADSALENLTEIEGINPAWDEAFFKDIKRRILELVKNVFGAKSVKDLKVATAELAGLQKNLLYHLTLLHQQITGAYRKDAARKKEILDDLGYTAYWKKAKDRKVQIALIEMLEVFEDECTPDLRDELVSKKISSTSLDFVLENLSGMFTLNVVQEGKKGSRKLITADVVDKFNDIYSDTIFYTGSVRTLFQKDPIRQKSFTFSHVVKQLGGPGSGHASTGDGDGGDDE